jgi:uncharacterized protein (TIGR02266 family)
MTSQKKDFDARLSRIPMKIVIVMDDGRTSSMTFCRNLSAGGMFLECVDPPERGSMLKVEFVMPNNMRKVAFKARVVWVKKKRDESSNPGIGVKFEGVSEAERTEIQAAVNYLHGLSEGRSA